jgi:uncharacterized Zn finger protein
MEIDQSCPYCGEPLTFVIDETGGRTQAYVEDCQVCCRPIQVSARVASEDDVEVRVSRLDD